MPTKSIQSTVTIERKGSPEIEELLAHISLDCVIFGFHDGQLKILLSKTRNLERLTLPGGFLKKTENLEAAAIRTLKERTGLENIFLKQFHVFSEPDRSDPERRSKEILEAGLSPERAAWFNQRFISVGYYALVEFSRVNPEPDGISESCTWYNLEDRGRLTLDHEEILQGALSSLRSHLNYQPIGFNLLPRKFTLPELQRLYEVILDKQLDRRNFQRKIFSYGILRDLDEKRTGGAHKAPYLYSFDLRKYQKALKVGLQGGW